MTRGAKWIQCSCVKTDKLWPDEVFGVSFYDPEIFSYLASPTEHALYRSDVDLRMLLSDPRFPVATYNNLHGRWSVQRSLATSRGSLVTTVEVCRTMPRIPHLTVAPSGRFELSEPSSCPVYSMGCLSWPSLSPGPLNRNYHCSQEIATR